MTSITVNCRASEGGCIIEKLFGVGVCYRTQKVHLACMQPKANLLIRERERERERKRERGEGQKREREGERCEIFYLCVSMFTEISR